MHAQLSEETSHSQQFEMVETRAFRQRLEAAIDALIATLDTLDPDPDLEPDSDDEDTNDQEGFDPDLEPSLARTEAIDQSAIQGGDDDREAQWEEEEDFRHC